MAISDKLTYLNTTKGKIKDAINLTNANILSEDTFRSYAEKLKLGLVDIINNGTSDLYNSFPKTTGTGTEIALNDTYEAPMEISLNGNTHQDSYTGKNLNIYPYATQGRDNGITFTINEDGTVILNGQNNNNGNSSKQFYYNLSNPRILEAGTYYIIPPSNNAINYVMYDGTNYYDFNANNNYSRTFNVQKEIQQFYVQVSKGNTTTFTNEKIYPMLSITPVTIDDYEKFVGGSPSPSPDYPQQVKVGTGNNTIKVNTDNYPINLGNLEVCKIGNYQDYIYKDGDDWYIEKNTQTITLDGTETGWGSYINGTTGLLTFRKQLNEIKSYTQSVNIICDHFVRSTSNATNGQFTNRYGNNQNLEFVYTSITSLDDFKNWLSTNNVKILFALTSPTITKITDETLIEQLNTLKNAKSVNDKTFISQINEQVPFILDVSALSKN